MMASTLVESARFVSSTTTSYLLNDVEVGLVVGVLDPSSPPRDVGQLPRGQHLAHVGLASHCEECYLLDLNDEFAANLS